MTSQFFDMTSSLIPFEGLFLLLSSLVTGLKFHVNVITGSGDMTIFFFKGLTRNLEIGNIVAWVLPNICRLGKFRDTTVTQMFLIKY